MSADTPNNNNSNQSPPANTNTNPNDNMQRNRRGSVTSAAFTNLFQRSNSTSTGTSVFPGAITTAAMNDPRRRMSVTTTLGLAGTSPTGNTAFGIRRESLSTNNSDSIDEHAVDEDDGPAIPRPTPTTPFGARRMSFGASAAIRGGRPGGNSPGSGNGRPTAQSTPSPLQRRDTNVPLPTPPTSAAFSSATWKPQPSAAQTSAQASNTQRPRAASDLFSAARPDQGFNWSEQLRSRAESTVASGQRPSIAFAAGMTGSPPRNAGPPAGLHDRARSVSDMPAPPAQAPKPRSPPRDTRPKPDHFQERILKGDFYMD